MIRVLRLFDYFQNINQSREILYLICHYIWNNQT